MGSWSEAILQKAQEVTSGLTLLNFLFQYDNVLMEEAAQILEIETFIPLLLQVGKEGIVFAYWTMFSMPEVIQKGNGILSENAIDARGRGRENHPRATR